MKIYVSVIVYKYMFKLDSKQHNKLEAWLKEQKLFAIEKQKQIITVSDPSFNVYEWCWNQGYPYYGAIDGGITYSFTPNSLGVVIKVLYKMTDETIDLTNYDEW